jgi:hypothetical protein
MMEKSITRLQFLCDTVPGLLNSVPDAEFSKKPKPEKWSPKEIVGHLIDSATNNHQRFIRIQYEDNPKIVYDQDQWNKYNNYNRLSKEHVIRFWEIYNRHLLEVIKAIPVEHLSRTCITSGKDPLTLQWLIDDYIVHLEYHMRQVISYD